jgi:MFS family permease
MTGGCLLTALGFFAMSRAASIGMFNLAFGLTFSLGNSLVGTMAGSAAVSRWFVRGRGRALGITTIGTSVGGIALPALAAGWIAADGWRVALENLALIALAVTPWLWFNIRGRPQELGLHPDGDPPQEAQLDSAALDSAALEKAGVDKVGLNGAAAAIAGSESLHKATGSPGMLEIIFNRDFWLIGLSVGLLIAAFSSTLSNLSPYATELGASKQQASALIMLLAVTGLVGKLVFGVAADRFSLKWGLWVAQGLVALAFLLMATEPAYPVLLGVAVCLGLATGGLLPVWNSMMAQVFGVDSYGRAMGAMGPVITLLIMPAYILVGRLHDLQGNYVSALLLFAGCVTLGALLLAPVRLP